jgi:hypothetical protein
MTRAIGMMFLLGMLAFNVWAAPKQLAANEVSASNLKSVLGERYGTSIDDDGEVTVKKGKYLQVHLRIDSKNKVLSFYQGWTAKPSADKTKCLEEVNRWNLERGINSVVYDAENKAFILCYYLVFTGGIDTTNLLDTIGILLENEEVFLKDFYEAGLLE